jgi:hypothetical protein
MRDEIEIYNVTVVVSSELSHAGAGISRSIVSRSVREAIV